MTNSQRPYGNRRRPLPPAQSPADGVPSPRAETKESGRTAAPGKQRDAFFDNAKYLAIVLVATGHAWEPLRDGSRAVSALYLLVYAFHMLSLIHI